MEAGREMDQIIATEVMGWPEIIPGEVSHEEQPLVCFIGRDRHIEVRQREVRGIWIFERWSPSIDIAPAMEIVEKLRDRHGITISAGPEDEGMDDWVVTVKEYGYRPFQDQTWEARADTLPLAICKAALLAVSVPDTTLEET